MASQNEFTGARLVTKAPSKEYLDNYDLIFKKQDYCPNCGSPKNKEHSQCENCGAGNDKNIS